MPVKKINVKKHERTLSSGKTTSVKAHKRSFPEKERISTEKFEETVEKEKQEFKLALPGSDWNWAMHWASWEIIEKDGKLYQKNPIQYHSGIVGYEYLEIEPDSPLNDYYERLQEYSGKIDEVNFSDWVIRDQAAQGFLVEMTPEQFLYYAGKRYGTHPETDTRHHYVFESSIDWLSKQIVEGKEIGIPILYVEKYTNQIDGHEGRHRATILKDLGIEKIPVMLRVSNYLYPWKGISYMIDTGKTDEIRELLNYPDGIKKVMEFQRENAVIPKDILNEYGEIELTPEGRRG
jgi:hypothetical protein